MKLTNAQARRFLVSLHFEDKEAALLDPVDQVVHHARRLGCIQYDPLNVVGRNPDLVLQSRIDAYHPNMLYLALYERRALIDGFDKNLAMYPIEDYPCFQRTRENAHRFWIGENEAIRQGADEMKRLIAEKGALCSDDIDWVDKVSWPWGATKRARATLESLWMSGDLILSHKKGARRYFDLAERYMDQNLLTAPDPFAEEQDFHTWRLRRRIGSVGLLWNRGSDAYLGMDGFKAAQKNAAFEALTAEDELIPVEVDGIDRMLYALKRDERLLHQAIENNAPRETARILAPLDNFLWDRRLIEALFGFYYRWEVYVPKEQRQYGYYVLPVMLGDRFIARFEPAHYRDGAFVILNWWWEEGVKPTQKIKTAVRSCLKRFAKYLGAKDYRIENGFE